MKKMMSKFLILVTFIFSFNASAQAFIPRMEFFVNREVAVTRVWNTTFYSVVCSGLAYGQTYQGVVLNTWINQVVVAPGAYAEAYVHPNYYDPMIRAWGEINCLRGW